MDYFLSEDDLSDDEAGVEGFYIFYAVSSYRHSPARVYLTYIQQTFVLLYVSEN